MAVRVYAGFDEFPEEYQDFFRATGSENYFLSLSWFRNLAATAFDPGTAPRLYAVEGEAGAGGPMAFLIASSPAGRDGSIFEGKRIGPRTLSGMTNYQSIDFAPLGAPEVADPAGPLRELVGFLCAEKPRWSLLDFNLLDPEARWFGPLGEELKAAGMIVRRYRYAEKRYEPIAGRSFEEYLAARPNNERKGIWRHKRQLERKHRFRVEILATAEPARLDQAIADYERVLAASWKQPERFPQYAAGLIRTLAAAGSLRLGLLYLDDKPVATQIWVVANRRACIYKLHYDKEYRPFSVGSILTAELMRQVIDVDGVQEVDFGLFEDRHKRAWMTQRREVWGMAAFNPRTFWGWAALLQYEIERGRRALLRLVKPVFRQVASAMGR